MIKNFTSKLKNHPHTLFLIDGAGALLSAILLGIALPLFQPWFGIPQNTLYLLASFPVFFAIYDYTCYFIKPEKPGKFIRIIAILNLLYCVFSVAMAIFHRAELTWLSWAYILGEVIIVLILGILELKISAQISENTGKI